MTTCDSWNARVDLGRHILESMLAKPVAATLEEMERALRDEVERRAGQLADLNEILYVPGLDGFVPAMHAPGVRAAARDEADGARAITAAYQLICGMRTAV